MRARAEFLRTQRGGAKLHTKHFLVFFAPRIQAIPSLPDTLSFARLGVTVTKKVGNAVVRNRVKRRVRELFRRVVGDLPRSIDLVVVAKHTAAVASFLAMQEDFERLVRRMATGVRVGAENVRSTGNLPSSDPDGSQES